MVLNRTLCVLLLLAAAVPLFGQREGRKGNSESFSGWPTHFEGRTLHSHLLSESDLKFSSDFPGKIARFDDGERELIIRWVRNATRMLHPAADCLRGNGFSVTPAPIIVDSSGNHWGCVRAQGARDTRTVCERVFDEEGNSWSDVSSWYWATILGRTKGPWWNVTVVL